ncbi:MAG: hypothetical protein PHD97_11370 [Bacteroidales bacterium]|nr:hypothetical protein [Bacteroidales bacterium]
MEEMENIIKKCINQKYFDDFKSTIDILYKYKCHKEDWYIATFMNLLDKLNIKFEIEKGEIDLIIEINGKKIFCEIKNWNENKHSLLSFLNNYTRNDFKKLIKQKDKGEAYLVIFYLPKVENDNEVEINKILENFKIKKGNIESYNVYEILKNCYLLLIKISSL